MSLTVFIEQWWFKLYYSSGEFQEDKGVSYHILNESIVLKAEPEFLNRMSNSVQKNIKNDWLLCILTYVKKV